ncbi:MAG: M24 family metallopeptidase, partial [Acidimicrobiales bacterium]
MIATMGTADIGDRARALLAAVAPTGARALVCYASARHFLTEADPVWWLTRFRPLGPSAAAIDPGGGVDLFVTPTSDVARATEQVPGARIVTGGVEGLERWAATKGCSGDAVALWGGHKLVARSAAHLSAMLGALQVVDEACEEVSRRRDAADLVQLEAASRLADEGLAALVAAARPGAAEHEVAAAVRSRLRELGAGDTFLLLSSSRHNLALHPPTERMLAAGDVILIELSPSVGGMYTQLCRTYVVGSSPARLADAYGLLTESLSAGAATCRPGAV